MGTGAGFQISRKNNFEAFYLNSDNEIDSLNETINGILNSSNIQREHLRTDIKDLNPSLNIVDKIFTFSSI